MMQHLHGQFFLYWLECSNRQGRGSALQKLLVIAAYQHLTVDAYIPIDSASQSLTDMKHKACILTSLTEAVPKIPRKGPGNARHHSKRFSMDSLPGYHKDLTQQEKPLPEGQAAGLACGASR